MWQDVARCGAAPSPWFPHALGLSKPGDGPLARRRCRPSRAATRALRHCCARGSQLVRSLSPSGCATVHLPGPSLVALLPCHKFCSVLVTGEAAGHARGANAWAHCCQGLHRGRPQPTHHNAAAGCLCHTCEEPGACLLGLQAARVTLVWSVVHACWALVHSGVLGGQARCATRVRQPWPQERCAAHLAPSPLCATHKQP